MSPIWQPYHVLDLQHHVASMLVLALLHSTTYWVACMPNVPALCQNPAWMSTLQTLWSLAQGARYGESIYTQNKACTGQSHAFTLPFPSHFSPSCRNITNGACKLISLAMLAAAHEPAALEYLLNVNDPDCKYDSESI